jgi:phage/conjugal plasmid C-4 type zinc finger TraR family protein
MIEEQQREDALQEQRRRMPAQGKTWHDSARECRICEEPIPLDRRKAMPGTQTCIECQRDLDVAARQFIKR